MCKNLFIFLMQLTCGGGCGGGSSGGDGHGGGVDGKVKEI